MYSRKYITYYVMVVGDEGYVVVSLLYNILLLAGGYDTENLFVASWYI